MTTDATGAPRHDPVMVDEVIDGLAVQPGGRYIDATVGLVNLEQNQIIKIFSVVAVVFMPPTLIASVYGMNFADMPELGWALGYEFSVVLMLASALATWGFFRIKKLL